LTYSPKALIRANSSLLIKIFIPKPGEIGSKIHGGLLVNKEQKLIVSEIDLGRTNWEDAKKLCSDYRGGGFDDWRLPTKDELSQIYLLHKMGVGGFVAYNYWSSSEIIF